MLIPLLLMALAFQVYYVLALFQKCRVELLQRERNRNFSKWVAMPYSYGRVTR
jgi:heme exporter protein C